MDIKTQWTEIRKHLSKSFRTSLHVSIASVDAEGNPSVTPIGSLFLRGNRSGYYFEKYPRSIPEHSLGNKNICVLAVDSSKWLWLKSLYIGKFRSYPGIKLYGQLGERREATEAEIKRLQNRMKLTKGLRGNNYLWGDMKFVREITFVRAEKINLGEMTRDL